MCYIFPLLSANKAEVQIAPCHESLYEERQWGQETGFGPHFECHLLFCHSDHLAVICCMISVHGPLVGATEAALEYVLKIEEVRKVLGKPDGNILDTGDSFSSFPQAEPPPFAKSVETDLLV